MFHSFQGKIIYGTRTDRGLCRNVNQDALWASTAGSLGLFVLSDGMGGHSRGELASNAITAEYQAFWQSLMAQPALPDFTTLVGQVQQVILQANEKIFKQYNQGQICGATVVVLLVLQDCYAVFWAGDSRIYSLRGRKYEQLTTDDIWDLQPFIVRNYTKAEIAANPSSGKLTQAVGTSPQLNVHVATDRIADKQTFLLCSDGLFKFCEEKDVKKGMKAARSEETIQASLNLYLKKVFDKGAGDNVSAILVQVE